MPPLEAAGLTLLILLLFFGIYSILFGLPGTIIIFAGSLIYALLTGFDKVGLGSILILAVLSLAAESLDIIMGARMARKFGASKKGVVASLIGAVIGAVLLTPFLLGLGTLIGAFLGGFIGTSIVEMIRQKNLKSPMRASYGDLLGRSAGIMVKGCCALIMTILVLSAIYS